MRRKSIIAVLVGIPLVGLMYWIASHTEWSETKVPMPPKGEALVNPFYAVQRFTEALGSRAASDPVLTMPSSDAVLVLAAWHWSLTTRRREAIEHWVESGGRLVVEGRLTGGEEAFERWSGISRRDRPAGDTEPSGELRTDDDGCQPFQEERDATPVRQDAKWICHADRQSSLASERHPTWTLRDGSGSQGIQAMRVQVGRGSVTVINAAPFRYRALFDGDHGWVFVAATQLRSRDEVHFLSEIAQPSLLALVWRHGSPIVVLAFALVLLAIWRGSVRLGPLAATTSTARRSLAEQIKGAGQFALRHGGGDSLLAAAVRSLEEAARVRIPQYSHLAASERATALARVTGFNRQALAVALHDGGPRRSHELRSTIALLEAARRQVLIERTRVSHGTE